jgi:hypothetical protein
MTAPRLGWGFWLVVALLLVGLGFIATDHMRRGGVMLSGALGVGALLRLVLPSRAAGGLASRSRLVDVLVMGTLAAGLFVITLVLDLRFRG